MKCPFHGASTNPCDEACAKAGELAMLLVESWDALAAAVKVRDLRLYNISPTLVTRIEAAVEPWKTGE